MIEEKQAMDASYEIDVLRNWINRVLDDTANPILPKHIVFPHDDIRDHLLEWLRGLEKRGILRFLADPYLAGSEDNLIEMRSYIDRRSAIPGFLNWEKPENT